MVAKKHEMRKVSSSEVMAMKGKLLEVRRIGAQPIYIKLATRDSVKIALKKADIPSSDSGLKIEGMKEGSSSWQTVALNENANKFNKIVVTTKVSGA